MKRTLWLTLILLLVCVFVFSACDDGNKSQKTSNGTSDTTEDVKESETNAHVHAFGEWTTVKNATCAAKGEQERSCSCGEKETKSIDVAGHTEVVDAAVAATCTTDGKTEGKHCSVCNTVTVAQTTVKAKGHTEVTDKAVAATCTTDGKTEGKHCSVCRETLVAQEVVAKLAHTPATDAAVEATCSVTGLTEGKHCSVCNATLVAQNVTNKLSHNLSAKITDIPETCSDDGSYHIECTLCHSILERGILIGGHSYTQTVIPPTALDKGYTQHKCTRCNDSFNDTYVAALGFTGFAYAVNQDGKTCTITGLGSITETEIAIPLTIDGYKVTAIGEQAFADCSNLTRIILQDSIKSIGTRAFYGCTGLTEITIPASVTNIGTQIFYKSHIKTVYYNGTAGTNNLENVFLNESSIENVIFGGTVVPYGICYGCSNLKNITLLDTVQEVESRAFQDCENLKTVNLGNGVQSLDNCSFAGCVSLESIRIPKSLTYMFQTFYQCKLKSVYYAGEINEFTSIKMYNTGFNGGYVNNVVYDLYINGTLLETLVFDDTQTTISGMHFKGSSIKNIIMPDSIRLIEDNAFEDCENLQNIFYMGSVDSWNTINIKCSEVKEAKRYYYSDISPTTSGNYWHYVNGVPTPW